MLNIVPMREEHIYALAEIERQCFSAPWTEEGLRAELESDTACFLVAEQDGKAVGYAGMHCICGECYVDNIAVSPKDRRRGIGRALVKELLRQAGERNGVFLSLEVRPSNAAALALYREFGFTEAGRRKNFYTNPAEDGLILTKQF